MKFVIKIAKPLSIAQSCWEYNALNYDLFPEGSCEQDFVHNMLSATGSELYAPNEVKNVRFASKVYNMKYSKLFSNVELDCRLSTVKVIDGVIKDNCWFAFAMTMAPGIPINKLIEGSKLPLDIYRDTPYRAVLHRCLDLLVYKFFLNILQHGFYHGDLHGGNIFFSYEKKQLTLIDFGAVGRIDIYDNNPLTLKLIDIILMGIYYNYDDLFDVMTELVNSKCSENSKIDIKSKEHLAFRAKLTQFKHENVLNTAEDDAITTQYKEKLLSDVRVKMELKNMKQTIADTEEHTEVRSEKHDSIYGYLEIDRKLNVKKKDIYDEEEKIPHPIHDEEKTSKIIPFGRILGYIIEQYAGSGVNLAIKFAEYYELLKAYVLIMGVLNDLHYSGYRMGIVMGLLLYDTGNLYKLVKVKAVYNIVMSYRTQQNKYDQMKERLTGKKSKPISNQDIETTEIKPVKKSDVGQGLATAVKKIKTKVGSHAKYKLATV